MKNRIWALILLLLSFQCFADSAINHIPELIKEVQKHKLNTKYALLVDYSSSATANRIFLINLSKKTIEYSGLTSHGSGSGGFDKAYKFSNRIGSLQSSLGCSATLSSYYGKHGKSLRLNGLDKSNNNNLSRAIVIHPADYVGKSGTPGRSWGCIGVDPTISNWLIKKLGVNALVMSINR